MRPVDRPHYNAGEPAADEPRRDGVGPQGAALILELERLRHAFDEEPLNDLRTPQSGRPGRGGPRPPPPGRQRPPKRQRKGKIERALELCLGPFGFNAASSGVRKGRKSDEPEITAPRRRKPVTLDNPMPMDMFKGGREASGSSRNQRPTSFDARSMPIDKPRPQSMRTDKPPRPQPMPIDKRPRPQAMRIDGQSRRPSALIDEPPRRPPMPVDRPPRAQPISIEPARPAAARIDKPQLAIAPPTQIETPRLALPRPAGNVVPKTAVGQLIEKGRAGVAFLVSREDPAFNDNMPGDTLALRTGRSYQRELKTGLRVLIIGLVLGGGWMVLMPLAGAVVVPGNLVVRSNVKTIQHPTGGVVAEIPVHNGARVAVGDLLLRLDKTQAQASLQTVSKQFDEARGRIARLVAERDGLPQPDVPPDMTARMGESSVQSLLASEQTLFTARASARASQKDLLQSRVSQLGEEIGGLEAQVASKAKQLDLITGELTGVQDLFDKRLVPLTRLTTLQRESARIEGERGQLISSIAETKAKVGEAQLQIVKIDQDFRTDVVKELGEAQAKAAELEQRSVAARDQLDRIELRSPTSGIIHQLAAHTLGGVIRAGDAIMEIVPDSDDLQVEARLQPTDIDQVRTGQKALIKFSAFNQRVTPQIVGLVNFVSPDVSHDQQSNASYFTVRMTLPEEERRRLAGLQLVSGMPAEVFLQTGSRTMMSYLLKPITEQLGRAFVER
jgi:HlyD family secretion protein